MFCLDTRSLAVMRIAYGVLILMDLIIRSISFHQHYTELGAYPLKMVFSRGMQPDQFSFHVLSGAPEYQAFLFLLHALAAVLLLLGWRTRLMTVICFVLAVSLQNRNYLILNGGDNWMRLVLFWAMFLPWGDRFSLDSSIESPSSPPPAVSNVATVGLILQVMAVYFVSALYKTGPAWRTEGSAAYLSLRQLEWNADLGTYLLYYPEFLVYATFAVFYFELIGPWLLISPVWSQQLRAIAVLGFVGFHLGLEFTMELGIFPYVGMFTLIGLFPALLWDSSPGRRLESRLAGPFRPAAWNKELIKHAGSSRPLSRPYTSLFLSLLIIMTLYLNAAGRFDEFLDTPQPVRAFSRLLGMNQYWGLFAPEPGRRGGWFVFEGILSDGSRVDLRTGEGLDWTEPRSSSIYRTQRTKRWMVGLTAENAKSIRPYEARYLLRRWDKAHQNHDTRLVRIRGHYLSRPTLLNFEDPGQPTDHVFMDFTRKQLRAF
jgi:hypothetical protein